MDMLFKMRPRIGLSHVVKLVNHIAGFVYSLIFPDDGEVCFGKIAHIERIMMFTLGLNTLRAWSLGALGRNPMINLEPSSKLAIKVPHLIVFGGAGVTESVFPHLHLVWTDSQFLEILRTTHQSCFCHTLISTYFR